MPDATPLPIDAVLKPLRAALDAAAACILQAPPGAGKTTRVPLALLDAPWLAGQAILMLEPRRLAATSAARFMARQLGEEVGGRVGYAIRHERKISRSTRIEVVTEGILTRRLQGDPELTGVGLVILDEFHERNLNTDLALALCRDVQQGLRPELRLLIMSATLDGAPLARLLDDCPVVTSAGRAYPVEVRYLGRPAPYQLCESVAATVRRALNESDGDLLVFLPGVGEINRCRQLLADLDGRHLVCPLYADLPFREQERAILPLNGTRKVVLATNIAETSLTIEGVRVVVDAGFERRPRFDAGRGMTMLETVRISQASSEQRAGRAGRLAPGVCYRLWSAGEQGSLLPFTPPEIRTADLAGLALDLARWGVRDVADLCWLDPPPAGHLAGARRLLQQLGALDGQERLTPRGEGMARLPAHPRLARLLLAAQEYGDEALGADLAALLGERELLRREIKREPIGESDLFDRLEVLAAQRRGRGGVEVDAASAAAIDRASRQFATLLGAQMGSWRLTEVTPARIARLVAPAWPDRLGREREAGSGRYLLSNGVGARLSPRSGLRPLPWLVAVEVAAGRQGEGEIHLATALDAETLATLGDSAGSWQREVEWDERQERIVAREVRRCGALLLAERPVTAQAAEVTAALCAVIRRQGLDILDWTDEARQFVNRVRLLASHCPEDRWPDLSPVALLTTLEAWLGPYLGECRTRAALERIRLLPALQTLLPWPLLRRLDELAPEKLAVPSGSQLRLAYADDGPPVLEVKLQELFGLADTPRIAASRVAVQLHLLSPARRPLAVTGDLRNFWDRVYPEVKKEMKGRYPKHPWPDDPWSAVPTRHTTRRMTG